ncbi:chromosome partitioning protein ParA [Photobacterium iliopiscarium]|jgi:chromosome partitioning protein|uniref:ParA family protein n=1 Tax=Photobacterium iliopiscarium TaxID=56192 RepID=A0ABX5GM00_9GAMM|nr:ParA family protein [Photobacterium iliopiscarium]KJG17026.1 chromosome partitioning protein ParA [Photobacterium iliopiscarium]PSW88164.1 ParA family protein [Photobacterium iliopiscarium]
MRVISLANQKGGVGKTTTIVNLASELAKKNKVLVIDLDPQGNCSKTLSNGQTSFDFNETIACLFDKPKMANIVDLIIPAQAADNSIDNLFLIPADYQLSRVIETSLTKINRERILEKHLSKISKDYDFVLLDTPPNLSLTTLNAIQASELIVIPIDSGAYSLDGISPLLDAVDEIKDNEANYCILRNEIDSRNTLINNYIEKELEVVRDNVLKTVIRRSEHLSQANALSMPIRFYKKGSIINNDYSSLAKEINVICNT